MNYYDSDAYKISQAFRNVLASILNKKIYRFDYIAKQLSKGASHYNYTRRILNCLDTEEAVVEKAKQDVVLEFVSFAVELGKRVSEADS